MRLNQDDVVTSEGMEKLKSWLARGDLVGVFECVALDSPRLGDVQYICLTPEQAATMTPKTRGTHWSFLWRETLSDASSFRVEDPVPFRPVWRKPCQAKKEYGSCKEARAMMEFLQQNAVCEILRTEIVAVTFRQAMHWGVKFWREWGPRDDPSKTYIEEVYELIGPHPKGKFFRKHDDHLWYCGCYSDQKQTFLLLQRRHQPMMPGDKWSCMKEEYPGGKEALK